MTIRLFFVPRKELASRDSTEVNQKNSTLLQSSKHCPNCIPAGNNIPLGTNHMEQQDAPGAPAPAVNPWSSPVVKYCRDCTPAIKENPSSATVGLIGPPTKQLSVSVSRLSAESETSTWNGRNILQLMAQQAAKFSTGQTHILSLLSRPPAYHVIPTPFADILLLIC